jgi:predicted acyl esterase
MRSIVGAALAATALFCSSEALAYGGTYFDDEVTFSSPDGTEINGNIFIPVTGDPAERFPAVIFVNSWALEEHEYTVQAIELAQEGYVVLSYSARGWGRSEGVVTVAGPEDMQDLSAGVDWLLAHAPVDAANIGISGISYGAGISLLGLAHEPRIKTAVAMSGWGSLARSIYGGESPSLAWGEILLGSGYLLGRMSPTIPDLFSDLLSNSNIPDALAWADERSPLSYVDDINARGAPVYISNNLSDELFTSNSSIDMFAQLTGPKRLDLNQGIHASAEAPGLAGLRNYTWDNVHDWLDYWLKGIDTGIMDRPPLTMEVMSTHEHVGYEAWPSAGVATMSLYLGPRAYRLSGKGTLETVPNTWSYKETILSGVDSGVTTGVPVLSPLLRSHVDIPVTVWTPGVLRANAIVYETAPLASSLRLRGVPTLDIWVAPSRPQAQLVAYLYDEDATGTARLITYGVKSLHDATPGQEIRVPIEIAATAYDVPAGHRIAIALDTYDPLYAVPTLSLYDVSVRYSGTKQSVLRLSHAR